MSEPRLEPLGIFDVDYDRELPYQELNDRIFYQADSIWNAQTETIHRHSSRPQLTGRRSCSLLLASFPVPITREEVIAWGRLNGYEVAVLEEAVAFIEACPNRLIGKGEAIVILGTSAHQYRHEVSPKICKGAAIFDRSLLQVSSGGTFSDRFQFLLLAT